MLNGKSNFIAALKGKGYEHKGEYNANVSYQHTNQIIDCFNYEGTTYYTIKTAPAGTLPTDTTCFGIMAMKGDGTVILRQGNKLTTFNLDPILEAIETNSTNIETNSTNIAYLDLNKVNKSDIDKTLSTTSENAVQNKVITAELNADLLWQNGNLNSQFALQTITNVLDMSKYKYIVVEAKINTTTIASILEKVPYVIGGTASVSRIDDNYVGRVFKIVSATSMYFDDGYLRGSKNNDYLIPYRVWGTNIL